MPVDPGTINGLLVVDKPGRTLPAQRLWTSHDVVARVRRVSGQRRIGHTGTLDPMASGVLVLCLGSATRLVEYYQGEAKRYYAEVVLGAATDTYDAEGTVTAAAPVPPLTRAAVEDALSTLRGTVWQAPPAYSAIKQAGEALYAKARRGEVVIPEARQVSFYRIDLLDIPAPDRLQLNVTCSAGAYVRSLAHDLGRALQTFGHLDVLRRQAVGTFTLDDAHGLAEIEEFAQRSQFTRLLRPTGDGLPLPVAHLAQDQARRLGHGQPVLLDHTLALDGVVLAQAYDETGALAGIIRRLQSNDEAAALAPAAQWKAEKWLV